MHESDLSQINQHPLNQEAKRRLLAAKADVTNDQPYLLQLIWWGMEEANLGLTLKAVQEVRARLEPVVTVMLNDPDKAAVQEYLLQGSASRQENLHLSLRTLQNALTPEDAAYRAIDSLISLRGKRDRLLNPKPSRQSRSLTHRPRLSSCPHHAAEGLALCVAIGPN